MDSSSLVQSSYYFIKGKLYIFVEKVEDSEKGDLFVFKRVGKKAKAPITLSSEQVAKDVKPYQGMVMVRVSEVSA
jgi:hypothetical protein